MADVTQIPIKDSILESVKNALAITEDETAFDDVIIMHINSAFATLYQAGVGPVEGFEIEDKSDLWSVFIGDRMDINNVKSYIVHDVRLQFDPPGNSFGIESVKAKRDELLWRLNVAADFTVEVPEQG